MTRYAKTMSQAFAEVQQQNEKYDLYHKSFSDAMQHAYDYAQKKLGITVDKSEIDRKVATGPRKPSEGKTNKYRLKGKGGNLQIQVYNKGGSKPFELNMYKEEFESDLDENKVEVGLDEVKFQVNYSKGGKLFSKTINAKNEDDAEEKAIKQFKIEDDDIRSVVKEGTELDEAIVQKYVLINMQGKVQGYTSDKSDALEIARRTKSTMHPIKKKVTDKTLEKMNALARTPKELKDLGIIEGVEMNDIVEEPIHPDEQEYIEDIISDIQKSRFNNIKSLIKDTKADKESDTAKEDVRDFTDLMKMASKIKIGRGNTHMDRELRAFNKKLRTMDSYPRDQFAAALESDVGEEAYDYLMMTYVESVESFEMKFEMNELKMNDPKLNKIFDKLKPKSTVQIKKSSAIAKGKDFNTYLVVSKNTLRNGTEKITLKNRANPTGVKSFLYRRDDKVTFAIGDMAASIDDIKEALDKKDEPMVKKVVDMLKKASQAHAGQAKDLEKAVKEGKMRIYRVSSSKLQGNIHAKDEKEAEKIARSKGMKGKLTITDRGEFKGQPRLTMGEGTWKYPSNRSEIDALKKLMARPIRLGREGEGAVVAMQGLLGDDELFDDFYLDGSKNENGDARKTIIKWFRNRVKKDTYGLGDETRELGKKIGLKMSFVPEENNMTEKLTDGNLSLKETVLKMWQEAKSPEQQAAIAIAKKEKEKKEEPDEGNKFSGELDKARKAGKKTFKVGDKEYKVEPKKEEFSWPEWERYLETKKGSLRESILQVWVDEGKMKDLSMKIDSIVAKMKKDSNLKPFADKFKKDAMKSMDIAKSLEKVLPDYISGGDIEALKKEEKNLTNEKENGIKKKMTDTGKEMTPVDTSPKMPKVKNEKNRM